AAEALARGMDKDPEVLESTKKIIVQKLTRDEFDGRVKLTDVTDADLQKYFEEHKGEDQKPEMARVSDIVIAFGADKAKAKKGARRPATPPRSRTEIFSRTSSCSTPRTKTPSAPVATSATSPRRKQSNGSAPTAPSGSSRARRSMRSQPSSKAKMLSTF